MDKREIIVGTRRFEIDSKEDLKRAEIAEVSKKDGVSVYKLDFAFNGGKKSGNIGVSIKFPMIKILQLYSPSIGRNRKVPQWANPTVVRSNFYKGLPSLSAISDGKDNYVTVAVSDADNDNSVSFCVRDFDEKEEVEFKLRLLCGKEPREEYSTFLRIDERAMPLSETLKEQTEWFSRFYPQPISYPRACDDALYSSWYNFHQHPSADKLYEELKIAKDMGFKTVIVDDGWQYDGNGTSDYIDCGDWAFSKEKFPDPKDFTDKVHALGMKVLLWFPAPFVGFNTKAYKKFKNKLLYEEGLMVDDGGAINAGILDVRYKDVRKFIVDCVKDLMSCGFDGMKIDFVDWFAVKDETPPYNPSMDTQYVADACVKLVSELDSGMKEINTDAMIEYRQDYVGPNVTRFCNMLRVADCAFDSITNRIAVADMRLLGYNLAVHSDMLYWAKSETEENVAKQLFNVAFSVPQISVLLREIPKGQLEVLKNFISYWTQNNQTLLHGKFSAEGIDCTYSMLSAESKDKKIVALYLKNDICYDGKKTDILNASRLDTVFVDFGKHKARVKVFDIFGKLIAQETYSGVAKLTVPVGGRVEIF